MNAHLYLIPSGFCDIPDKIFIKAQAMDGYPSTWWHAVLPLPEEYAVLHSQHDDQDMIAYGHGADDFSDYVFAESIRREGIATISDIVFCDKDVKPIYRAKVEWN